MKKTTPVQNIKNAVKVNITEEKAAILTPIIKATMIPGHFITILKKMKVTSETKTTKEMKIIKKRITAIKMKLFKIQKKRRKMRHQESLSGLPEAIPRKRRKK